VYAVTEDPASEILLKTPCRQLVLAERLFADRVPIERSFAEASTK
jgi:hypothetical protein